MQVTSFISYKYREIVEELYSLMLIEVVSVSPAVYSIWRKVSAVLPSMRSGSLFQNIALLYISSAIIQFFQVRMPAA